MPLTFSPNRSRQSRPDKLWLQFTFHPFYQQPDDSLSSTGGCDDDTGKVRRTGLGFEFSGVPNPNVLRLGFTSHVYLALAQPLSFLSFLSSLTLSASLATVPQLGAARSFVS
jgi:hypothetical protein